MREICQAVLNVNGMPAKDLIFVDSITKVKVQQRGYNTVTLIHVNLTPLEVAGRGEKATDYSYVVSAHHNRGILQGFFHRTATT